MASIQFWEILPWVNMLNHWVWQQAIPGANVDPVLCCHIASLGHNELNFDELMIWVRSQKFSCLVTLLLSWPDPYEFSWQIVHHHGLRIVAMDISIETAGPKFEHLPHLITDKTVAIMIAHIYGKWSDMQPIIDITKPRNIKVIEDCAESFCGFRELGHPESDLSLFSFGVIKHFTAFGGAIAKVKDPDVYCDMLKLYQTYPTQSHTEYLKKLLKYSLTYLVLDTKLGGSLVFYGGYLLGVDHKKYVIKMLRGFPNQLLTKIRRKPCDALLSMMVWRLKGFTLTESSKAKLKVGM